MAPPTVVKAQTAREGAGFLVHRPFPTQALYDGLDPFLLLDQMGPEDLGPRQAKGAPDHPHRGFETVTYMLEGAFEHHDSQGNHGILRPGDVQWMTAGSGVIHSEMPESSFFETGGRMHGVQLWVNLPAKDKMTAPRYQDIPAARIPEVTVPGGKVRVISGEFGGQQAVIETRIPIQYLHFILDAGAAVDATVPSGHNGMAYVLSGEAGVGGAKVSAHELAVVNGGPLHIAAGPAGVSLLVISGRPIGEPVARYGPFVMNTQQQIVQAIRDFNEGKFGSIKATMEHGERKPYLPSRDKA